VARGASSTDQPSAVRHRDRLPRYRRRYLAAVSAGNALEWFDWNSYAIFVVFFSTQFFPAGSDAAAYLKTLAIFAIGFFFRPLGAILISDFTDRHGRRAGLTVAMLLMAGGTVLIAVCPTYDQIGLAAPLLLLLARILQGLSTGGEYASTITYITEIAPPGRRAYFSSLVYISSTFGALTATLLAAVLISLVGEAGVTAWGWRVPFALGATIGLVALYLRRSVSETELYLLARDRRVRRPTWEVLRRHPIGGLRVAGFTVGATVVYYTFAIYLPGYAQRAHGMAAGTALWASVIPQVIMIVILPFVGRLSDRIGRKPLLVVFASGFILLVHPFFNLLGPSGWSLLAVMTGGLLLFACWGAVAPAAMAELFPTHVRSAGLGLPYAATVAVFGGTAPYVVEMLSRDGHTSWFAWYVTVLCLVSLGVYLTVRETKDESLER
jgi:MHS family alpha-ketoglutarate permease-like MFS transporter